MEKPVRSSFQYLSISYECALAIGNSLNLSEMLQEVIHTVVLKTNAHRGIIWVKNREQELQPVANAGINIEDVMAQGEIRDLKDVLNQILKRQQFVLKHKDDNDFLQYCPVLIENGESVLIVPVTNVAILYLVYASREIADETLANLLASLSKKLSVAIEVCTTHENVIKEIKVREKAEKELTKKTEQQISSEKELQEKELQEIYGESEQARKSLLSILEDVTQKEEALRESEERFRTIFDSINDAVFIHDMETGAILDVNRTMCEMYGYSREEVDQLDIQALSSGEVPYTQQDALEWNKKAAMGDVQVFEWMAKHKSGHLFWVEVNMKKAVIGLQERILVVVRDITERKQVEEALQVSERKYRRLFDYSNDIIVHVDKFGKVLAINNKLEEVLGLKHEEVIGKYFFKLGIVGIKDLPVILEMFKKTIRKGIIKNKSGGFLDELDLQLRAKNGNMILVETSTTFLQKDGKIDGFLTTIRDVTERKQAEDALKQSEYNLLKAQEIGSVGTWELDIKTNILIWTDEVYRILGIPIKTPPTFDLFLNYIHPDDREYVNKKWAAGMKKNDCDIEHRLLVDGKLKWIREKAEIIYDNAGVPIKTIGFIQDITERMNAKLELQESQANRHDLIENSPDGIIIANADEKHIFANNRMCEITGYGYEELMEITIKEMTPPEDQEKYKKIYDARVRSEEVPNQYERSIIKKDGSIIPVELRTATTVWDGKKCGLAFITDITERKKTETALRESENRLKIIFESAPDAYFLNDFEGTFIDGNKAAENMVGYSREELIGKNFVDAGILPEDKVEIALNALTKNRNGKSSGPNEYILKRKDGTNVDVEIITHPVKIGDEDRVLGIARDITKRKQGMEKIHRLNEELEKRIKERTTDLYNSKQALVNIVEDLNMTTEELKSANERLQELDRMKSMFIASTSHELRTPLNSIIGFTSILLEGWSGELNPEQKEQLGMVHTSGKHLLNLINDVIDISKIEAGKLDVYISEFKLKEVVDEVVSVVRNDIDEKGLTLTMEVEDITLISDSRRLLQSFLNLLSNAVKFTNRGNIVIQAKSINSRINISVTDSGIGVKHEDIPKLFTPFVRLESPLTDSTSGTGLGLYLTKKLTEEALGGTVDVISEYGKGSTFILNIPIEMETQK